MPELWRPIRVHIPGSFAEGAIRRFGDAGRAWAAELPSIVEGRLQAWHLADCRPIENLSINYLCFCTSPQHGQVVLKVQGPHEERYTEIEALQLFRGRHCCRILAVDLPSASMLLERANPGSRLRDLPDRAEQLSIGARMVRDLPLRTSVPNRLPTYVQWLDAAGVMLERTAAPSGLRDLLADARRQYDRLLIPGEQPAVMHGDLYHDNILRDGDRWMVIDPQGVAGPAVLEAGRFIENHAVVDFRWVDWQELQQTTHCVASVLEEPYARVLQALSVLHVLSLCWDWEMHAEAGKLEPGERQCREILQVAGGL